MIHTAFIVSTKHYSDNFLTLHLNSAHKHKIMDATQKFAELIPIEIRESRLFLSAVLDSKGNILTVSDSLLSMFSDKPFVSPLHYTEITFKEDLDKLRDALALCLVGKTRSSVSLRMHLKSSTHLQHVLWELIPTSVNNGDEALVLCIGTRMNAEMPIATPKVKSVDADVVTNLLNRNRDLEQFANIVAHNIRSPLANIMGLNKLLNLNLSESDKATALAGINTSAKKLESVIKDLNEVMQIRKSAGTPGEPVDLRTLIDDVTQSISSLIDRKNGKVICDFTEAPTVRGIRAYLQSVVLNLITNALKYSRPEIPAEIHIKSRIKNDHLILSVSDNGVGIDLDKHRDAIFGLYKRFNDNVPGKGLGLYMVKTQVEVMNGTIDVTSTPGVGSEFVISLPL